MRIKRLRTIKSHLSHGMKFKIYIGSYDDMNKIAESNVAKDYAEFVYIYIK